MSNNCLFTFLSANVGDQINRKFESIDYKSITEILVHRTITIITITNNSNITIRLLFPKLFYIDKENTLLSTTITSGSIKMHFLNINNIKYSSWFGWLCRFGLWDFKYV